MKKPLFTILMAGCSVLAVAQSTGPNYSRSTQNVPFENSESSWLDLPNASGSDDVFATFEDLPNVEGAYTDYLFATNFNFNIPTGYRIKGIEVVVETLDQTGNTADHSIRLIKKGEAVGNDNAQGNMFFNANVRDQYTVYGGPNDLWGEEWTAEDINSSFFGVAFSAKRAKAGGSMKAGVDDIRIVVYFVQHFATLPLKLTSFSAIARNEKVIVSWNTIDESSMDRFTVERSVDGTTFNSLGDIACTNRSQLNSYSYTDNDPVAGTAWYRLKMISVDGATTYSKIVTVYSTKIVHHYLFPSPWKIGSTLFIRNPLGEKLTVCFYSSSGELLSKTTTSGQQVNPGKLKVLNGNIHYKILNALEVETGSGKLIVY